MSQQDEILAEEPLQRKPYEDEMIPVTNDQQLGQDILRTFARISDPPMIVMRKVRRKVPIIDKKTILHKGKEREVECITGWEEKQWDFPILVQPKYHEQITDDISRAFLSEGDLEVWRSSASYSNAIKSFAERYDLNLSLHHNSFVDENLMLVVSSGAFRGKRVNLAKTNLLEQTYRATSMQQVGQISKKKKGFWDSILPTQ